MNGLLRMLRARRAALALVLALGLLSVLCPAVPAAVPWLLAPLGERGPGSSATMTPAPRDRARLPADRHEESNPAGWRAGARWRLPFPGGGDGVLIVDDARPGPGGLGVVRGRIEGEPGSEFVLTAVGGVLAGSVRRGSGEAVLIEPGEGRRQWLAAVDAEGPGCGNPARGEVDGRRLLARQAGTGPAPSETQVLDLAWLYTAAAEQGAGGPEGMRAWLELAILEANDAFARSGAPVRLRPVLARRAGYVESGDLNLDLSRLTRSDDGVLDEAHVLRDEHAADVVCLVVEAEGSNQFAGMANQLRDLNPGSIERGFLACVRPYLVGNYTLPHEVGHVLGCDHDRDNGSASGLHPWSYGTRITVEGEVYRTVMAYRPGRQFPHFSNPLVRFRGVPTGTADGAAAADNVRTLQVTGPLVAAAREPAARVGFATDTASVPESAGTLRLELRRTGLLPAAEVTVRTLPGSAVAGQDFEPLTRRVSFPDGGSTAEVLLGLVDNAVADGSRRLAVILEAPGSGVALGPIATVTVTITDDEEDGAAVLDTSFRSRPGGDYLVTSLGRDSEGRFVVGGGFATFNEVVRPRLARVLPDGTVDPGFAPDVKYRVHALAVLKDGRLVLGGDFNTVNGQRLNHVALLLADGRCDPGFAFDPGTDYPVHAVAEWPGVGLVVGGAFTRVQNTPARSVARLRWNGTLDPGFATGAGPDAEVLALLVDRQGGVVIAGRFARVNGVVRGGVARLDAQGRLDSRFAAGPGASGTVCAVAADANERVMVAGDFTAFDGRPAVRVVRLLESGVPDPAFSVGAGPDAIVHAVLPRPDGSIWIGGAFTRVGGHPRNRLARLQADGAVDPSFDPGAGPNDSVLALAAGDGGTLVAGGVFTEVQGVPRGGLAGFLSAAPEPARFVELLRGDLMFQWRARVSPRQRYDLEQSADLQTWQPSGSVSAATGWTEGAAPVGAGDAGFLRLRRRLE